MAFDLTIWKEQARDKFQQLGAWLQRRKNEDAPYLVYGALCSMSLWPLVEAAKAGQLLPVMLALGGVAGGVGGNLLANQIQQWADQSDAVDEDEVAEWVAENSAHNSDLQQALDEILQKLDTVSQGRATLDSDTQAWFDQSLRQELSRLGNLDRFEAHLSGVGAISQGQGAGAAAATAPGSMAIGRVEGSVYLGSPPPAVLDADTALNRYLRHVIESNRCLQLQGIRSAGQLVSIELEQVYITLTATEQRTITAEQAWLEETTQLAPGEAKRLAHDRPRETVTQVKVKVQEALAAHPRLVVLGDPGCGKTTLLRYLALTYARDQAGQSDLVQQRLDLTEQRLPILLPLRDFARYLETKHPDPSLDGPKLLLDYLRTYFANQDIALPERFFADRLQRGECVVLLDGVDEVADLPTRHRIARIIERFTIAYPDNRYVVSSRIVGYTGPARLAADYALTTVRDFTRTDIERFVTYWNLAVELVLAGEDTSFVHQQAAQQTEALLQAIRRNERVRELAVNPLLLTVIALVQRYRAQLPERRTELYEEAIEVLLGQWDVAKGLADKTLVAGRELDAGDRRSLLEPVALWMMERQLWEIELAELRQQLGSQFARMVADERQAGRAVAEFVRLINERSGLLLERGQGVYSFSHLTFQEHLAARAVADREDYVAYTLDRLGDSWWREVILLEAGYLSTQGKRRGTALIQAMMNHKQEPAPYHNLVLAAECLRDVGAARIEGDLWGEVQQRLRREFEQPLRRPAKSSALTLEELIRRRAAAAEALARIESGGSGTQPAFWRLPYGEPVWVDVPAGEFVMGTNRQDLEKAGLKWQDWMESETPQHKLHLDTFQIARVPVTNAQYLFFVEATGHQAPKHWEDKHPPRGQESHPVVYVSWHDALAYCRWLSEVAGKQITLPTEAQWEKAARRTDGRIYPWGNEWDETKCNAEELGLGGTTPVGIFPDGASPYGCLDMSGNVWEWCCTKWQNSYQDYKDDNDLEGEAARVWRGGAFFNLNQNVRCAYRNFDDPRYRLNFLGFRVVCVSVSPSTSES